MSGGSYAYLFTKDAGELHPEGAVADMADRLAGLAYAAKAAADTKRIIQKFEEIQELVDGLRDVWYAVEWWDSADGSEDKVRKAVSEYAREHDV